MNNPVLIFTLILFIILLVPMLTSRLKVPSIVGLILAGIIVGPHGFNLLEKNTAIELFSTIGLLYIMFLAGLELNLHQFRHNRNKSILFGVITFLLPIAIGIPACYYILGYNLNTTILTASMFATHTLISYPIVSRFQLSQNESVAVTVGGTILTDTAVLILLTVLIGLARDSLTMSFWFYLFSALTVFSLIMFGVIPRVASWFFKRLDAEKNALFIFVLSMVFFGAFLAQLSGVEAIIGAFAAGFAMNRMIPASSGLMNRLEFTGNALFIPFFLISIGMLVDPAILFAGSRALYVALVLTLVAISGKWLAALATQKFLGFNKLQRKIIFGLSTSHAAATLAIITVGYKEGILDEYILNGTILLIFVTCIASSMIVEKTAKRMVAHEKNIPPAADAAGMLPETLLISVANPINTNMLLDFSSLIINKKIPHSVRLLSIINHDNDAEENLLKMNKELDVFVRYASDADLEIRKIVTIDYSIFNGIIRSTRENLATALVMGWPSPRSIIDKLFGKIATKVIESLRKNIFVCHLPGSLNNSNGITVICPPNIEWEPGFSYCMEKIVLMAERLKIKIRVLGEIRTLEVISNIIHQKTIENLFSFQTNDVWENTDEILRQFESSIDPSEICVFFSTRTDTASYQLAIDILPAKFQKRYPEQKIILIYPE